MMLFEPFKSKHLQLKNRVVMSAMTRSRGEVPNELHELIASINYNEGPETELSDITEQILDPITLQPIFDADPLLQRSDNTENQSNFVFQADYIQPML